LTNVKRFAAGSVLARVTCARGQKMWLCPHQQKLQSLNWKIDAKSRKKQKLAQIFLVVFEKNAKNAHINSENDVTETNATNNHINQLNFNRLKVSFRLP